MTNSSLRPNLYIGSIGFSYEAWGNGVFYPSNLPRSDWLPFYAQHFNSVEISHSFSKLIEKETCISWHQQTGPEFKFSLRGNQYITHAKKLKGVGEPLKLFMDPLSKLQEKLACIVWEIPTLGKDQVKLLEGFFKHLKKYSQYEHFFDFHKDITLEQTSLHLLAENKFQQISYPPQDSLLSERSYFRILREEGSALPEWENDFLHKLKEENPLQSHYIYFGEAQAAYAVKQAQSFLNKLENS